MRALCTVHSKTAVIPVVSGRSTRVARRSLASMCIQAWQKYQWCISMVCIQAWLALKPDAESGLCAYTPGFYSRLYGKRSKDIANVL